MIDRRGFLLGLAAASVAPAAPAAQAAQAAPVHRVGVLDVVDAASNAANLAAFRQRLAEHGHVEGRNLVIEYRSADGRPERLTDLATELVRLKVDLIVTRGTPAALSAKQATKTTPIVMASSGEPVAEGIVASLARPGGNITGFGLVVPPAVGGEKLRLLNEAVPGLSRVGVLWNPTNIYVEPLVREVEKAGPAMGVEIKVLEFDRAPLAAVFEAALIRRIDALIVMPDYLALFFQGQIIEFATMSRLPAIYGLSEFVDAGGFMSYGPDRRDLFRRAATYVHRIFEGARPAELPIEMPTKLELAVNLKTARTLGLTLPPSLLSRAEHIR